jgi:hypothetical protein
MRRRQRTTLALVLLAAAFPGGYFFFWGMHVSSATTTLSGPIYFMPLFAPLVVLIATALVTWWRERRGVGVGAVVVLALVTVPFAVDRIHVNQRISESQVPWRDGTDAIHGRATVFVQSSAYLLFLNPFSSNPAHLDGRILWATDQGGANLRLIAEHPDRVPYLQETSVPPVLNEPNRDPVTPVVTLQRLRVLDAPAVTLRARITNTTDSPVVVASLQIGDHVEHRTVATDSRKGATYDLEWRVQAPGVTPAASSTSLPGGAGELSLGVGFGARTDAASQATFRQAVAYRASSGTAEYLLPSQGAYLGTPNDVPTWVPKRNLPEIQLRVAADGVG